MSGLKVFIAVVGCVVFVCNAFLCVILRKRECAYAWACAAVWAVIAGLEALP